MYITILRLINLLTDKITAIDKLFGMKMTDHVIELVKDLESDDRIDNCRELS